MPMKYLFELLGLAAIWGSSFMLMRITVPEFGVWAVVVLRACLASLVLLPFVLKKDQLLDILRHWVPITVVGLSNTAIPFSLFAFGSKYLPSGLLALLNGTAPLFAALIAWLWLRDRMTHLAKLGFLFGFLGVYFISYESLSLDGVTMLPVLACLGATLGYGFAVCYIKKYLADAKPLVVAFGSQVVSTILLLPLALMIPLPGEPSLQGWLAVLFLAIVCTGIAYMIYFRLIVNIGVAKAIYVGYLVPLFGIIWGMIFLGETISGYMIVGGLTIVLGVALTSGFSVQKLRQKFQRQKTA